MEEKNLNPIDTVLFEKSEKFGAYADILAEENEKFNITALDRGDTFLKHFADSAYAEQLLSQGALLCDVGSGGGFPAMVLKLLRDDLDVTLIDAVEKKTEFLRRLADGLGLTDGLIVKHIRAEEEAVVNRAHYDVVTARAVAPLPTLLEYAMPLLKVGGKLLAFKGANFADEVNAAENAARTLYAQLDTVYRYSLGEGDRRVILSFVKTNDTPDRYPRKNNNPRRKPL